MNFKKLLKKDEYLLITASAIRAFYDYLPHIEYNEEDLIKHLKNILPNIGSMKYNKNIINISDKEREVIKRDLTYTIQMKLKPELSEKCMNILENLEKNTDVEKEDMYFIYKYAMSYASNRSTYVASYMTDWTRGLVKTITNEQKKELIEILEKAPNKDGVTEFYRQETIDILRKWKKDRDKHGLFYVSL